MSSAAIAGQGLAILVVAFGPSLAYGMAGFLAAGRLTRFAASRCRPCFSA